METITTYISDHWRHGLEVFILWVIIYFSYRYFRATRGARIFTGLVGAWLALTLISLFLELTVIAWLLKSVSVFLALALVVIFQPELRRALAELGSHRWFSSLSADDNEAFVDQLAEISELLAHRRIGALMAIERGDDLRQYHDTGVQIGGKISKELLLTIFYNGTILHDGGVILRQSDERILAAGCVFPLNQRELSDRAIGLRHRAAMGLTEESDALCIAISEETGTISLAVEGQLERNLQGDDLRMRIRELLFESKDELHADEDPEEIEEKEARAKKKAAIEGAGPDEVEEESEAEEGDDDDTE